MKKLALILLCGVLTAVTTSAAGHFWHGDLFRWKPRPRLMHFFPRETSFQRVGTFANYRNNADASKQTVSEITAATADGRTLIYTDSPMGEIGFVNIANPANPLPAGKLALPAGHEPTSVDILGNRYALVAVNSSESFANPSGYLAVIDLASRTIVRNIDLGGQPDSIKISPDGKYAAIAIENERNEALCVGGSENGLEIVDDDDHAPGVNTTEDLCEDGGGQAGVLPQAPAGYLAVIDIKTPNPISWTRSDVSLIGLSAYAPDDPEPEFVDINDRNLAVVTLQENNHIAIVDLKTRTVVRHFPAGAVDLTGIDTEEDGVISLTGSLVNVAREPDAVAWVPGTGGQLNIATANEGDLFGGSRGFSIFRQDGTVVFDSGATLEEIAVQHGHYPEDRSENKGTEPEAIHYARFGGTDYLFVGSERGSFIAVYVIDRFGRPQFEQILPAPLGPEGLTSIPHRNLLIASGEEDDPTFGVRSTIMIYQLQRGAPVYPQIVSDDTQGAPIAWSALSGLTAIPGTHDAILGVWDVAYSESRIFRIDISEKPAVITDALTVSGGGGNYDPEGIAVAPDGTFWIASEGTANDSRRNLLVHVDPSGNVLGEFGLPAAILACRAATTNRATLGSGFEGVAILRDAGNGYRLIVPQQRGWDYTTPECEDFDDDAGGLNANGEPNYTRLWIYDPAANTWDAIAWELAPLPANAAWVGLSEITAVPWGEFVVIERDNLTGPFSKLKTLVKVNGFSLLDRIVTKGEKSRFDLLPSLKATNGWITDKPEGLAVLHDGRTFLVTDNDGLDGWSGESWFLQLGHYWRLF